MALLEIASDNPNVWEDIWNNALSQCKARLRLAPAEYEKLMAFASVDKLTDDLHAIETNSAKPYLSGIASELGPILLMLDEASRWFVACMKPSSIKVTALWGLLHLTIKVEHAWARVISCTENETLTFPY